MTFTARRLVVWLLPLVAVAGCTARTDSKANKTKNTLPPAKVDSELPGRYLLIVGKTRGVALKQPSARWCYLDIQAEGNKLQVDAWRPDDMEVTVTKAKLKHDGQIHLTLKRAWLKGADETTVSETWELKGFLKPLPRSVKRKPKKTSDEDEDEDEEPARGLAGSAKVSTAGSPRAYTFSFTARSVPEDQQLPWEDPPGRRRGVKPTMADLEKAHKAGKLDFESIPAEMKDAARKKFGS